MKYFDCVGRPGCFGGWMFVGSSGFPEVVRDFYLSGELSYPTEDLLRTETSSHPSSAFSSTT